jgi:hypothetical protein
MIKFFCKRLVMVVLFLCWIGAVYAAETVESPTVPAPAENAPAPEESKTPSIQIDESVHDFGELPEGEVISHDFKVKNVGDDVLVIENVRPG